MITTEPIGRANSGPLMFGLISDSEFRLFRDLIYEECGISLGVEKRVFLESRLRRRIEELGFDSAYEYYRIVTDPETSSHELPRLLDSLMICETSFFRNRPQFDLLKEVVLPELIARKEKAGTRMIRVWSAGCSTGQEPYSAVMALLESLPNPNSWMIRVYASDLSFSALERAQAGLYRPDQLKGIEPACIAKYFHQEHGYYIINESVSKPVVFDYHNLKHDNGLRGMDIVFCRNVMIYFDSEEQKKLVSRFANCLVPGGFLFLGHAESLQGLSTRFAMLHRNKGIAYKLEG